MQSEAMRFALLHAPLVLGLALGTLGLWAAWSIVFYAAISAGGLMGATVCIAAYSKQHPVASEKISSLAGTLVPSILTRAVSALASAEHVTLMSEALSRKVYGPQEQG